MMLTLLLNGGRVNDVIGNNTYDLDNMKNPKRGIDIEVTIEQNTFKDLRILTEVP